MGRGPEFCEHLFHRAFHLEKHRLGSFLSISLYKSSFLNLKELGQVYDNRWEN